MSTYFKLPEGLTPSSIDIIPVLSSTLSNIQNISSISSTSVTSSQSITGSGLLTVKDIPPATDELKKQLQKACKLIGELPDMDRTIAEQEEEILDLEDKIRRQREIIRSLRGIAEASEREAKVRCGFDGKSLSPTASTGTS